MPMPSKFDPELASRLLAKAGVKVSPAELRARASPTASRRSDMRLEPPRAGASEADSCGGDDPEDLTVPLSLRYSSPMSNTVITKVSGNSNSSSNSKNSTTIVKSLDSMHGNGELSMAPLPHGSHHAGHNTSAIAGSAILDTYLQFIAENSGLSAIGLGPEHAAAVAHAAKMRMSLEKHGSRGLEDYPMIGRDEGRGTGVVHEDRQEHDRHSGLVDEPDSSGADDDEFSENEEPEITKE